MSKADRVTAAIDRLRECTVQFGPAVESDEIAQAEGDIGFAFPDLLTTIWLEVGAVRLVGHPHSILRPSTSARRYLKDRRNQDREPWEWPEGLSCIADLGCGITACVDLAADRAPIWWFDPNLDGPVFDSHAAPWRSPLDLEEWIVEFAEGSTFAHHW